MLIVTTLVLAVALAMAARRASPDDASDPAAGATTAAPTAATTATTVAGTTPPEGSLLDGVPPVPTGSTAALLAELRTDDDPAAHGTYRRDAFGDGWTYDGRTGCNTRELVLADESGPGLTVDDRCRPVTGTWTSRYDGVVTHDITTLEIDHLVPLADAWRSGADRWTAARRLAFANDRTDPATLDAVTAHANRSKGDGGPDRWVPTDPAAVCPYVRDWVRIKARWSLSVTTAERRAILGRLADCGDG